MMERRHFLKTVSIGGIAVVADVSCLSGYSATEMCDGPWDPDRASAAFSDLRIKLLCYAALAPSPHNTQPWKINLEREGAMVLYVDAARLLPHTDPFFRQIYIGQGTFLEALSLAAPKFGLQAEIQLFPEGDRDPVGSKPVAFITLKRTETPVDPLFFQLTHRATNRRSFDEATPTQTELNAVAGSITGNEHSVRWFTGDLKKLTDAMHEGMTVETQLDRTHGETLRWIRFRGETEPDGFAFRNIGLKGMELFFADRFSKRSGGFEPDFRRRTLELNKRQLDSAKALGVLFSKKNDRAAEVVAGRQYLRIHLQATASGLAMHPMTQVLQEYEELKAVRERFAGMVGSEGGVPQMVFRIGRSSEVPHSCRREAKSFLI